MTANTKCAWTIVMPTNVWGPWRPRYPKEFWKVLKNGLYVHPGMKPVLRSYGYVKNVVSQMEQILDASSETINKRVFYLGDRPRPILEWINAFSKALTGREVRIVPRNAVRVLARVGDHLLAMGAPVPIYISAFQSMTEDYLTPVEGTFTGFGASPYSLDKGVNETIMWLWSQSDF
jgi:nucleoside-diphosphate-sugar epimerase